MASKKEVESSAVATATPGDEEVASDPELEELLDKSLGEFGTHVFSTKEQSPPPKPKDTPTIPPSMEAEFSEVFSEEFAAQAEAQLGEAMKMLQSENPEIWKQFEQFSNNLGMPSGAAFNPGVASHGESSTDQEEKEQGSERGESLEGVLKDTLEKLKLNAEGMASGGDSAEGPGEDDELLKMMQGMMASLLSKDVLYPSLTELCKQYPSWLREHEGKISPEDFKRYSKQLEIMHTICQEFESQPQEPTKESSDKILSLMQELQRYGQPPAELSPVDSEGAGFLPPGTDMNPQNCSVM